MKKYNGIPIVYSKVIPFKGFFAMNLMGIIFVRKEYKYLEGKKSFDKMIMHESIHTKQLRELGHVGFYILYVLEWLFRLITPPWNTAYKDISFEKEAYDNADNPDYLATRKPYAQWRKKA